MPLPPVELVGTLGSVEALGLVCVLAVSAALTVLPFALIFYLHFWQPRRWARAWVATAQALGLELEPYQAHHRINYFAGSGPSIKQRMLGRRGGLDIEVGVRIVVSGSGKNRSVHYYTYARAYFGRDLNMGLTVTPVGWLGRVVSDVAGQSDVQIGDQSLDRAYTIRGIDPPHVRALLTVPYVVDALQAATRSRFQPYVSDSELRFEEGSRVLDAPSLGFALDQAVDLARRVIAAHEQIGPSDTERAIEAALRDVASRRALAYDARQRRLTGRVEGMHVEVDAQVRGQHRWTRFTTRFDRPLGVRLRLTRQGALSGIGKLLGMQDVEVGDPVFDARFVVKGAPEAAVRAVLGPEVCARLTTLSEQSAKLTVEDDHIEADVAYPMTHPDQLEQGLLAMARVGAAMCRVTPNRAGPFRG